ncbi:MFS transporter [Litoreibacter roseus]|uniref:MFS transporter n=1 Tax=Litoreibacter roseus TaxID=2601869 RepID=A0A6N6JG14_9RHOB|nr:MFS transporter [Litoreibacter roseus]GFE64152.1 MFS transporter [Litoreibacter roseus]
MTSSAHSPNGSGGRTDWPLIALLFVAGLFAAAQFGKYSLTLRELALIYPDSPALVPFLVSIVGTVGVIFGAVAGALVAKLGMSRMLLLALVVGALLAGVQALLLPLSVMLGLRIAGGFCHLVMVVALPTIMASESSDRDRPVVMAIWAMFFGVSFALTGLALPFVLGLGGVPLVFLLHGAGLFLVALAVWWRVTPVPPTEGQSVNFIEEHRTIYTTPSLLISGLGFVWYTMMYIALLAVLPGVIAASVLQLALLPIGSLVGTFGAGILARRFQPDSIAIAGFVATIVAMALVWVSGGNIWLAIAMMVVMGVIPGASFASIPHFNAALKDRARATGGLAQLGNVGTTLGTPIFVMVAAQFGLNGIFGLVIVLSVAGIACLVHIRARILSV